MSFSRSPSSSRKDTTESEHSIRRAAQFSTEIITSITQIREKSTSGKASLSRVFAGYNKVSASSQIARSFKRSKDNGNKNGLDKNNPLSSKENRINSSSRNCEDSLTVTGFEDESNVEAKSFARKRTKEHSRHLDTVQKCNSYEDSRPSNSAKYDNQRKRYNKDTTHKPETLSNPMPNNFAKLEPLSIKSLEVDDLRCYSRHPASKDLTDIKHLSNINGSIFINEVSRRKSVSRGSIPLYSVPTDSKLERWMTNLPLDKRNLPIHRLLIPGSHDSFSYSLKWGEISPDSPVIVPYLAACFPCLVWPALLRWSVTQRATVYEQLIHGIRYFDIRVAVRNNRFYFVHGLYGEDLEELLAEIREFLDSRQDEVVLLDFQHLHGLSKEDHQFLGALLKNVFTGLICPPYESLSHLSLTYLSNQKYQVLIFYRHSENLKEFGFWPETLLPNPWPRTTKIATMMSFVNEELKQKCHKKFFVTQCVLTPTGSYLSRNLGGSLKRKMADPCNKEVLRWIQSLSSSNKFANVIMTDFVDNDDWAIPRAIIHHNNKNKRS